MTLDMVTGVVRALVAAVGGYFVGKGTISADMAAQISGAALAVVTAVWSVWAKKSA